MGWNSKGVFNLASVVYYLRPGQLVSDFRFQFSDFVFQISDSRFQISDFRFEALVSVLVSDVEFGTCGVMDYNIILVPYHAF